MKLAKRSAVSPSLTLAMNSRAKQMKGEGIDVISFAAGEPDFPTPPHIREAGKRAIDECKTYYTPASGIPELKAAVVKKLREENGLSYEMDEVIISCGAKHSVYNALSALVDEGDEVIIPAPYWVSYSEMVSMCGGASVFVPSREDNGFKIRPEDLHEAVTPKARVLILNSPCNPTGAVYGRDELLELARFLQETEIIVLSDEIYEKIVYDGNEHVSIASLTETMKDRTVVVNGMSKAYSMTGWRIGYAAGPSQVIQAVGKMQGHTTGNPASISQYASLHGLEADSSFIGEWVEEFKRRKDYVVRSLNGMEGVSCFDPQGAFYVFPRVDGLLGKVYGTRRVDTTVELAYYLLEEGRIAVVPGEAFGAPGHIRLSYATSMANIEEGLKRLREAVED
jgi:aspartate aminotransferase